jgi:hypothetical protein
MADSKIEGGGGVSNTQKDRSSLSPYDKTSPMKNTYIAFQLKDNEDINLELRQEEDPQKVTIDYEVEEKLEPAEDIKKKFNSTHVDPFNRQSP